MHALHAYLLRFVPELTEADWLLLAETLQTASCQTYLL